MNEWEALVKNRPDLEPRSEACATNPHTGEQITVPLPHGAFLDAGRGVFLHYTEGRVVAAYDEAVIPTLREIAVALGASLHAEEGGAL